MYFAFILNEFGPKVNKWIHRVYQFGLNTVCITLGLAENGNFTNKKDMEKLI